MDAMPAWALALNYWLHMLATVVWLGSLSALALLVLPAAARTLDSDAQIRFVTNLQSRLESLSWGCMFLLVATGMFQMSGDANFTGLISTENAWSAAMLAKHLLILVMGAFSVWMSWGLLPEIRRALIRYKKSGDPAEVLALRKREARLMGVSMVMALAILAITAVMQVL